jgi:hypothetical protein
MARPTERERRNERAREAAEAKAKAEAAAAAKATATGKESTVDARVFADEVHGLLNGLFGEPPTGEARTEGERLAAVLHLVFSLLREHNETFLSHSSDQNFTAVEGQKWKITQEAITMFLDIANRRRHPVHKFFAGSAKALKSRTLMTTEVRADCRMIACLDEILTIGAPYGMTQTAAIKAMMARPGIMAVMRDKKRFENVLQNKARTDEYVEVVQHFRRSIQYDSGPGELTIDRTLNITEWSLKFGSAPLIFEEATRTRQHQVLAQGPDGKTAVLPRRAIPFFDAPPHALALGQGKKVGG